MISSDVEQVLDILSNSYRREILRLLTIRDRYAFELSKDLNISQRAVSKHLIFLKEMDLVTSEKRKSLKGPAREYFMLNQSVVVSLTIAPNLFLTTVRPLDESKAQPEITPSLRLSAPDEVDTVSSAIFQGLELVPQIKDGLDLLQAQQSKLLRGYQGIQSHISEYLKSKGFESREIRLILKLIENEGSLSEQEITVIFGNVSSISDTITSLKDKELITDEYRDQNGNSMYHIVLTNQ